MADVPLSGPRRVHGKVSIAGQRVHVGRAAQAQVGPLRVLTCNTPHPQLAGKQGINAALADKLSVTTNQSSNHSITKSLPYDALYQFLRAVLYVCFL